MLHTLHLASMYWESIKKKYIQIQIQIQIQIFIRP